jgi:hypothetical protein
VFAKQAFSSVMRDVQIGQGAGKVIGKNGLDLAGMWKLENVYVHVAGNGYAAYRIHNGAIFDHCNGIDTGPTGNFDWAVVGDNVAEDGVLNKASVTFIGSNIESFTRYGVRFKDYSFGTFIQTSIIGGNGSTVSVQALRWELTNPNDGGIFDARSSVALASNASWANGYPLHVANGGAPIYMMGTNGNLNQFYRESDSTAYALNSLVGVALPVTTGYFVVGNYGALSATNRLYLDANGYAAARNGFNSGRYLLSNGGGVRTADFALSAGWGATASVTALAGMDQSFDVTVISSGGGQAANPTITHTHRDGAFSTAPGIVCAMNGGTGTLALVSAKTTKTSAVITYSGTPVAGSTYSFTCNLWGR